MTCRAWGAERLLDHAEGRLPASEAAGLQAHLAGCEACRRTYAEVSALARLGNLPPLEPGAEADRAVRRAIDRAAQERRAKPTTRRIRLVRRPPRRSASAFALAFGSAAAAAFLVLVAAAIRTGRPDPRPVAAVRAEREERVEPPKPEVPRPAPGARAERAPAPAPEPPPSPVPAPRPVPAPAPGVKPPREAPPSPVPAPRRTEAAVPVFGRVARLTGRAERGGAAVAAGDPVAVGESLACRSGVLILDLEDGSQVAMRAGSALSGRAQEKEVSLRLAEGEVACSVAARPDRRFSVETSQGTVTVKGTIFAVRAGPASASVAVAKGRVEARTEAGAVEVKGGERSSMSRSTTPARPEPIAVEKVFQWAIEAGMPVPHPILLPVTSAAAEWRAPMMRGRQFAAGSLSGEPAFAATDSRALPTWTGRALAADRGEGGWVTFTVDLRLEGPWYLWGRFFHPGTGTTLWKQETEPRENDPNSFYASVDGRPEKVFGNLKQDEGKAPAYRRWHWAGDGSVEAGRPAPLALGRLAPGRHAIRIRNRDAVETSSLRLAPRLDVLLLTTDPEYRPRDEDFRR